MRDLLKELQESGIGSPGSMGSTGSIGSPLGRPRPAWMMPPEKAIKGGRYWRKMKIKEGRCDCDNCPEADTCPRYKPGGHDCK